MPEMESGPKLHRESLSQEKKKKQKRNKTKQNNKNKSVRRKGKTKWKVHKTTTNKNKQNHYGVHFVLTLLLSSGSPQNAVDMPKWGSTEEIPELLQ